MDIKPEDAKKLNDFAEIGKMIVKDFSKRGISFQSGMTYLLGVICIVGRVVGMSKEELSAWAKVGIEDPNNPFFDMDIKKTFN